MVTPRRSTRCLRRARPGGFTLIEMLVTVALLVIILYMLATAFRAASAAFNQARTTVEAHQIARAIMDIIHDDLVGARLIRLGSGESLLFEATEGGDSDRLNFTTTAFQSVRSDPTAPPPTLPQIVEVRYVLNGDQLMKQVDWDGDLANDGADEAEAMGHGVVALNFRYFDPRAAGRPAWTSDGNWARTLGRLPAAVEITLVVQTTDPMGETRNHEFSQVIYLPDSETQGG